MSRADDPRLHDYLDGRLSEAETRAFEQRMRGDPLLARAVAAYRAQAEAVRQGDEELSPGFYTRVRARFEESRQQPVRWTRHLLSWEAVGLVVAAVLVGALFLPGVWEGDLQPEPTVLGEPSPLPEPEATGAAGRAETADETEAIAPPSEIERQPLRTKSLSREMAAPEPEPGTEPAPAPAPRAAAPGADRALEVERDDASGAERSRAPARMEEAESKGTDLGLARAASEFIVALTRNLSGPDGLREVIDLGEWNELVRSEPALGRLRPPHPNWRLVLLGPGDGGLDCTRMTITHTGDTYEIEPRATGPARGCAFVLPRDGKPVRILR